MAFFFLINKYDFPKIILPHSWTYIYMYVLLIFYLGGFGAFFDLICFSFIFLSSK